MPVDSYSETTRRALSVVLCSESLAEAKETSQKRNPLVDLSGLMEAKQKLSQTYLALRLQVLDAYRQKIASEPLKSLLSEAKMDGFSERRRLNQEIAPDLEQKLLKDAAAISAVNIPGSGRQLGREELLPSYDGSLKYYIQASRWVQIDSFLLQNMPGRNDAQDVLHFVYMDQATTMISDDALSNRICSALWPGKVLSVDKFRELETR